MIWSLNLALLLTCSLARVETCKPAPEILYLHDASVSLRGDGDAIRDNMALINENLSAKYNGSRFGYSSWTDKPIPFRGEGFRNLINYGDVCYSFGIGLTEDTAAVQEAMTNTKKGYGGDFWENPFEAILNGALDPRTNWTQHTMLPDGRMVVRIIVVTTDDLPHVENDAYNEAVEHFNAPVFPEDQYFLGGFGHRNFSGYSLGYPFKIPHNNTKEAYLRLCDLNYKTFENSTEKITPDEQQELDDLIYAFGPPRWPIPLPHPGTFNDTIEFCQTHEYPSFQKIGAALQGLDIFVVMLLKRPTQYARETRSYCLTHYPDIDNDHSPLECMKLAYEDHFQNMGVAHTVLTYDGKTAQIQEVLQDAIDMATSFKCEIADSTTTTTSTVATTESETVCSSTSLRGSTSSTYDDDDESGSYTPAIIAGAAGGVAGLVVIGALVYRRVNGGFFKGEETGEADIACEEVSWTCTNSDRESSEAVTDDMFK